MVSDSIKKSERAIYNRGYGESDILPNKILLNRLLSKRDKWIDDRLKGLRSGMSVLDVGCGIGNTSIKLAKRGFNVTGIDISDKRISTAKTHAEHMNVNICFLVGDIENSEFTDGCFDLISCTAILHHLPDVETDLDKFSKFLKDGGSIIATEPGLLNPFAFIRRKLFPTSVHTPDEHPFVPSRFIRLFQKYFSKVEFKYFYIFSLIALLIGKILGEKAGLIFLKLLEPVDAVFTRIPFVKELSWIITVHAYK